MNDGVATPTAGAPRTTSSLARALTQPWLLALVIVGVYAISLGGGWLDYDDDWLVRDNERLGLRDASVLSSIASDFGRDTRLVLGAEYLPLRDLVTWIGRAWLGLDVLGFRLLCLTIYAGACATLLVWSRRLAGPLDATSTRHASPLTLAIWLFALHPVHVESVAWIAGLKDVLALLFVALALLTHANEERRVRWLAVLCVMLACASKSVAVVTPALLVLIDLGRHRRLDVPVIAASSAVAIAWAALHAWVGSIVGMYASPLGEGPIERVGSVAVVLARYVGLSFFVHPSSVVYDVEVHGLDASSIASVVALVIATGLGALAWRRGERAPLLALGWFVVALLPTSQVVAPLQNRMADRYLLVAVLAPCLALAVALDLALRRVRAELAALVVAASLLIVSGLSAVRAATFADPIALFLEATQRTEHDSDPPSLLAHALMTAQQYEDAEFAYRMAIARDGFTTDHARRDGNSLGQLLAGLGRSEEAVELYATLVARYPDDPRVLHNLAVMEARVGRTDDAARHQAELAHRFPDYRSGAPDRPGPL